MPCTVRPGSIICEFFLITVAGLDLLDHTGCHANKPLMCLTNKFSWAELAPPHSDDAEGLRAHVGPQVQAVEASSRQSGT